MPKGIRTVPVKTCPDCGKQFPGAYAHRERCIPCARGRHKAQNQITAEISKLVALGHISRKPCEVCGTTRQIDAHHDDYSKPLDVRWLCRSHHRLHHVALRKAQPA